ncbi:MAG: hypothetical protein GX444_00355 [Myxococcales bacterium]|nr:hypothetical protein [Myxococcales bacterium]
MNNYLWMFCFLMAASAVVLAPGCSCFEDEVEDAAEDVVESVLDEFFIDGIAYLELDPIVVDYPADGGQPACVTTSIVNELDKLGADAGPEDFEQIWLWTVFQAYSDAAWTPVETGGFNCTAYLADADGEVELDWPTIDASEADWWHNLATLGDAQVFLKPYLTDWNLEFQACVRCDGENDTRSLNYLFKLQVATEKKD